MKTIERQIRNHEFRIDLPTDDESIKGRQEEFFIDGLQVHRDAFNATITLLSAEAPK